MGNTLTPNWLKALGFTVVPLPRETYGLFHLFAKANKHYDVIGDIFKLYKPPGPDVRPEVHRDREVSKIKIVTANRVDVSIGLKFLKGFLSLFSAVPVLGDIGAAITAGFKKAKLVEIEYDNVLEDMVYPIDLAPFVEGYEWRGSPAFLGELLEKGKSCVIHAYLKSDKFNLRAYDEKGSNIAPEVSVLKDLFEADAHVEVGASEKYAVTFEGEKALPVAVKAMKVKISKEKRFQLAGWTAEMFGKRMRRFAAPELPTSHAAMEKFAVEKLEMEKSTLEKFEMEEFSEEEGPITLEWKGDE